MYYRRRYRLVHRDQNGALYGPKYRGDRWSWAFLLVGTGLVMVAGSGLLASFM